MVHMYLDDYWLALGSALQRITYLPDVVIEHVHPLAGKAKWDLGYTEVNGPAVYEQDRARYVDWLDNEAIDAVARLQAVAATRCA
jgi:hypothetical protein